MLTILDAIRDPSLFDLWFLDSAAWRAWFAFLATLFGLPMAAAESALWCQSLIFRGN